MKLLLPLFALLLTACSAGSHAPSMAIDDADAWQAICKDGTRVRAVVEEGICADHRGVAMWTNKPRAARMAEEAAK
ncbi:hypothetical protein OPFLODJI_00625 [Aeromonas hydrophila]|uniref:hypothetical protein n=1 Tax=Aeromonas TaxID=642 RepID=UPI0005CF13B2|nr:MULTISPECIES: hypothetical protein [Aeromonas]AJQ55978.1 hypothetical protein RY45_18525 [Aeromonas hydrophila]AKA16022.1 hypothetical protein VU14_03655 [Aeromonas hydrophila]ANT66682.1 hypothetical protein TK34_03920 [Aeromonas hydrophila]EHK5439068.1 hypothetical protein [Aeromonas hydrophila]KWR65923.1 hypothetical protein ATO50_18550 [Aeromonas hydrophila]